VSASQAEGRGFLDEARALAARGLPDDAPGVRTLGYRELLEHLAGRLPLDRALATIALRTRQLAKRQETWFRKEPDTTWFTVRDAGEFPRIARTIAQAIAGPIDPGRERAAGRQTEP